MSIHNYLFQFCDLYSHARRAAPGLSLCFLLMDGWPQEPAPVPASASPLPVPAHSGRKYQQENKLFTFHSHQVFTGHHFAWNSSRRNRTSCTFGGCNQLKISWNVVLAFAGVILESNFYHFVYYQVLNDKQNLLIGLERIQVISL